MSRRGLAAVGAAVGAAVPTTVLAHAVGGVYQLPVPLWLYLLGAAVAVAVSFVVLARRHPRPRAWRRDRSTVPAPVARVASAVLGVVGLVWWFGAIAVGFLVGDISPLPAVLLWVGVWISLPLVAVMIGNPWPALSPFRSTARAAARLGARRPVARYPADLARWPAVALLGVAVFAELILPGGDQAGTVAVVMTVYTAVTLAGMAAFGAGWLRNAELFEVLLGWYGRIGPLRGRRVRPWLAGLVRAEGLGWSDAAFVVLLLAGVTYDGLRETSLGAGLLSALLPPVRDLFGTTATTFLVVDIVGLVIVYCAFLGAFAAALQIRRRLAQDQRTSVGRDAGSAAAALVPIAAGYLLAHYLTLVVQAAIWLPALVADPLTSLAPEIDWIPIALVWYVSVAAIVAGHVAAVAVAHARERGCTPVTPAVPMVALMLGYTVLSLWIIAQPIVLEPGAAPLEARVPELAGRP